MGNVSGIHFLSVILWFCFDSRARTTYDGQLLSNRGRVRALSCLRAHGERGCGWGFARSAATDLTENIQATRGRRDEPYSFLGGPACDHSMIAARKSPKESLAHRTHIQVFCRRGRLRHTWIMSVHLKRQESGS